jgi:SAM-dependent methyltransferase
MNRLNLGCGQFKKKEYVNVDWDLSTEPDVCHDLSNLPYPFEDNRFEVIELDHVLEHLPNTFDIMHELHRICAPDGKVIIRVPHFSRSLTHPEHKCGFDFTFPFYFNPDWKGGYAGIHFEQEAIRMRWFSQPYLKRKVLKGTTFYLGLCIGKLLDFFANLSPAVCSRIWCFFVGGFEEIEYSLICRK